MANRSSQPLSAIIAVLCLVVGVLLAVVADGNVWMYVAAAALALAGISLLTNRFGLGR